MSDWSEFKKVDPWSGFKPLDPVATKSVLFKEAAKKDLQQALGGAFREAAPSLANRIDPLNVGASVRSTGAQIGERAMGVGRRGGAALLAAIGMEEAAGRQDEKADDAHRWAKAYEEAAAELTAPQAAYPAKQARNLLGSFLPSAALAKTTRTPYAPIGYGAISTGSEAIQEAHDAGLSQGDSLAYAGKQAVWETLPALLFQRLNKWVPGLGGTESALASAGKTTVPKALLSAASEGVEENIVAFGQRQEAVGAGVRQPVSWAEAGQEHLDTTLVAGLSAGMAEAPGVATTAMRDRQWAAAREGQKQQRPDLAAQAEALTSPAAVTAILKSHRAAGTAAGIEALAGKSPSRSEWEKAGLKTQGPFGSGTTRARFASTLQKVLEAEAQPAQMQAPEPPVSPDVPQELPPVEIVEEAPPRGLVKPEQPGRQQTLDPMVGQIGDTVDGLAGSGALTGEEYAGLMSAWSNIRRTAGALGSSEGGFTEAPPAGYDEQAIRDDMQFVRDMQATVEERLSSKPAPEPVTIIQQVMADLKAGRVATVWDSRTGRSYKAGRVNSDGVIVTKSGRLIPAEFAEAAPQKEVVSEPAVPPVEAVAQEVLEPQATSPSAGPAPVEAGLDTPVVLPEPEAETPIPIFSIQVKKPTGAKPLSRSTVASVFPGARITDRPGGWRVEVGQSYVDIDRLQKIDVDWDTVEKRLGRPIPKSQREKVAATGQYMFRLDDGTTHDGLGIIRLAEGISDDGSLRHEALHLARKAGLLTEREWAALKDKYAQPDDSDYVAEERVAQSREAIAENPTVWERIKSWLNRLLASVGITKLEAKDVHTLLSEAGFWQRPGKRPSADAPYQMKARPDLANPVDAPAGSAERSLVDQVDADRTEKGEPKPRSDVDVQAEAKARLESDYAGEKQRLLDAARTKQQLSDVDTTIAKAVVSKEAAEAVKSGNVREAMDLIDAYRRTGTEQARGFRQRRDPVETPAERMRRLIVEAILTPPEKVQKQIETAESNGDEKEAKRLKDDWEKKFAGLKKKLLELGVDLDNLNEMGYSPIKEAKALSTIAAAKASKWDKAYEYWRNAILSAPRTQSANAIGNFGHAAWHFTAERLVEAGLNSMPFVRRAEGAQIGELPYVVGGMLPGLSRGARNFLLTWQTELPQFDKQLDREGQFKIESPNVAIEGAKGRVIRMPQRLLLAVDDFARTLFANLEVGGQAYRLAKAEGKEGEELRQRIAELTADVESEAWSSAYDISLELAFQQKGNPLMQRLKRNILSTRRDLPGLRYILPFVTTPANIVSTGLKKTPLGSAPLAYRMYKNYREGKHVLTGATAEAAQQLIAWALVLALMGNDEREPWITGAESELHRDTRELARRTHPPQSVRLGDTWYSYSRVEPFATAIGMAVDWTNSLKSGEPGRTIKTPFTSVVGQLKDKTFLSGIGDIVTALEAENMDEKAGKWSSNFAVSWVPNAARSAGRALDDEIQQRSVWGKGSDWWAMLLKRTAQKAEVIPGVESQPMYDLWGRPIAATESPVPMTDWLYRMTVPADNKLENIHPGDRLLLRYNNTNPDDARYPGAIRRSYAVNGETKYMTDEQFAEYSRVSGQVSSLLVEAEEWPDDPTTDDMDRLETLIIDGRKNARDALVAKWEGGSEVDTSEKGIAKLAATPFVRRLGTTISQSVPKREREKGIKYVEYRKKFMSEIDQAREFLAQHNLEKDDVLEVFSRATADLEPENRARQRATLLARLRR